MTLADKFKIIRLPLNLSQSALAEKTGMSELSLYWYEQTGIPQKNNIL